MFCILMVVNVAAIHKKRLETGDSRILPVEFPANASSWLDFFNVIINYIRTYVEINLLRASGSNVK
jgi:hypothetical protein